MDSKGVHSKHPLHGHATPRALQDRDPTVVFAQYGRFTVFVSQGL